MQKRTIIIYSSVDGQTKKICQFIKEVLTDNNHYTDLFSISNFKKEFKSYDKIIIASSVRYGNHNEEIEKFIGENYEFLNSKKAAFISVNLVARKTEKNTAETNPYVIKFLNSIEWKPYKVAVFAGTLNYKLYTLKDRILIKLIMLMTKGPTSSKAVLEYTDWNKVEEFAEEFVRI